MQLNIHADKMTIISDDVIKNAEEILIHPHTFDEERLTFIRYLETCDLLAVPGSGKTTALLAKLFCLSQYMPFENGSGILVLSHTNAAINEIKSRLNSFCPQLFEYPNFIGTIQSFVDHFLANPMNVLKYNCYLSKIDDELANKEIKKSIQSLGRSSTLANYLFMQEYGNRLNIRDEIKKHLGYSNEEIVSIIKQFKDFKIINNKGKLNYDLLQNKEYITQLDIPLQLKEFLNKLHQQQVNQANEKKWERLSSYHIDYLNNKFISTNNNTLKFSSASGKILLRLFEKNLRKGIARYKDCYALSSLYLYKYPQIKKQLQQRFKYIFIDESQDLEELQLDLIDDIFIDKEVDCVIQRIGDPNQAIYSSSYKVKEECDWVSREELDPTKKNLYLTGSNRLTKINAELVNYFKSNNDDRFKLQGKKITPNSINPHLLLFCENSKDNLIIKFKELIKKYNLLHEREAKYGFKIIGWTGKKENANKLCLYTLFVDYNKIIIKQKTSYARLDHYIQCFDKKDPTLKSVQNNLFESLVAILRYEEKKIEKVVRGETVEHYYTKADLTNVIRDIDKESFSAYDQFNKMLFNWCFTLVTQQKYEEVYNALIQFIRTDFKKWFNLQLDTNNKTLQDFLGEKFIPISDLSNKKKEESIIDIATVHSVKGQTHCATMYIETEYYGTECTKLLKIDKKKGKLPSPLLKEEHEFTNKKAKEAIKMMYVGFSRPTHLLCFAVLKKNVEDYIADFQKAGWEVLDLTKQN